MTATKTKKPRKNLAEGPAPVAQSSPPSSPTVREPMRGPFKVPLWHLLEHPNNPRDLAAKDLDLESLASSMRTQGLLEPILVRQSLTPDSWIVLSGHRRWKAAEALGWESIDAREVVTDDAGALAIVLTTNDQHKPLDPLREGASLVELVRLAGGIKEAAARIGRTVPYVAERVTLPGLSKEWQKRFHQRPWSLWPLRVWALLAAMVPDQQDAFMASSRVNALLDDPMLEPKDLEGELADWVRVLGKAPFPIEDATLVPDAGPCSTCPKQSQHRASLFETGEPVDLREARCGDRECWALKSRRFLQSRVAAAKKEHGADVVVTVPESHVGKVPEGVRVLQAHRYSKAKKGDKGAVPAISATSKGSEVSWVKVKKTSGPSGAHREREKGPSLDLLRAQWDGSKLVAAGQALAKLVAALPPPPPAGFLAVVLVCGWEPPFRRGEKDDLKTLKAFDGLTPEKMLERAWPEFLKEKEAASRLIEVYVNLWNGQPAEQVRRTLASAKLALEEASAKAFLLGADPKAVTTAIEAAMAGVKKPAALVQAEEAAAAPAKSDKPAKPKGRKGSKGKAAAAGDEDLAEADDVAEDLDDGADEPRARAGKGR